MMLKWVGDRYGWAGCALGSPARDLTEEEVEHWGLDALLATKCYELYSEDKALRGHTETRMLKADRENKTRGDKT